MKSSLSRQDDWRRQRDLHHRAVTRPALEPHNAPTGEPLAIIDIRHTYADAGMASRCQEEFTAVVMGTVGGLASPADRLIQLVQKDGMEHGRFLFGVRK